MVSVQDYVRLDRFLNGFQFSLKAACHHCEERCFLPHNVLCNYIYPLIQIGGVLRFFFQFWSFPAIVRDVSKLSLCLVGMIIWGHLADEGTGKRRILRLRMVQSSRLTDVPKTDFLFLPRCSGNRCQVWDKCSAKDWRRCKLVFLQTSLQKSGGNVLVPFDLDGIRVLFMSNLRSSLHILQSPAGFQFHVNDMKWLFVEELVQMCDRALFPCAAAWRWKTGASV